MTTNSTKIVSVWYDDTSDSDEPQWIVDTDIAEGGESDTLDTLDTEEEAMESGREEARKRGAALYTVDSHGSRKEVASAELMAMEALLLGNGDRFSGGPGAVEGIAEDWIDNGFDADSAGEWMDIGVWDAATAATIRDSGKSPVQITEAADRMIEENESDDYTDGSPIYAACNNDIPAQSIIDECDAYDGAMKQLAEMQRARQESK